MGIHIQSRLVPDPSMTDAQFLHEQAQERDRANRTNTKINLEVGKVRIEENAMSRIGALCFIRRRLHHHEVTAERFKNLYEARYGSGNPALDPSRVQVDTSPLAHDSGMAAKIDRTDDLTAIIDGYPAREGRQATPPILTKADSNRIIACVILGIKCEDAATIMPSGHRNRRHVKHEVDALLDALDSLSTFWGYRTRGA